VGVAWRDGFCVGEAATGASQGRRSSVGDQITVHKMRWRLSDARGLGRMCTPVPYLWSARKAPERCMFMRMNSLP
jgi:hypothetical protein